MATNKITKQDRQAFAAGVSQLQELSADFEKKLTLCQICQEWCETHEKNAAKSWQNFLENLETIAEHRKNAERAARRAELCLKTAVVATLIYMLFCFFGYGH